MSDKPLISPWLKNGLEYGPLLAFFVINAKFGIFSATIFFMISLPITMLILWLKTRHIPLMSWVTGFVVMVFGGLTIYLQNDMFIKLKPTILNGGFALFLAYDYMRGATFFRGLMEASLPNPDPALWKPMTRNWALFFCGMAILNEAVWRSVDTDTWVTIKTFVYLPLAVLVFPLSQIPLINRHIHEDTAEK